LAKEVMENHALGRRDNNLEGSSSADAKNDLLNCALQHL